MKLLGVMIVGLLLVGCAPQMTLEQLENQAMLTGDWTQVEARERAMHRKAQRDAVRNFTCTAGYIAVCENRFGKSKCSCVDRRAMRDVFASF